MNKVVSIVYSVDLDRVKVYAVHEDASRMEVFCSYTTDISAIQLCLKLAKLFSVDAIMAEHKLRY